MKSLKHKKQHIDLRVTATARHCPIGETVGQHNTEQRKIPVLSCEGACIRGEIARLAANMIAKETPYGRGCHGELIAVPDSSIARWIQAADKVVLIDGCYLRCHGRILEHMLDAEQLVQFDALAVHKQYSDIFDADDVPEAERVAAARQVADHVLDSLDREKGAAAKTAAHQPCCGS